MSSLNLVPDGDEIDPKQEAVDQRFLDLFNAEPEDNAEPDDGFLLSFNEVPVEDLAAYLKCSVNPEEAAHLLSGHHPTINPAPENNAIFKFLKPLFRDRHSRTLEEWAAFAKEEGIKVHRWLGWWQNNSKQGASEKPEQAKGESIAPSTIETPPAWDTLTLEEKKASWDAMSPPARRKKAAELVKKHNGNKTKAAAEVDVSRERIGQIIKEGKPEEPEAPLPDNHYTRLAGLAKPKRGKASR